jgi:uncharacterized protein YndB with AHSA1/START domain
MTTTETETTLRLERSFDAPRERVFDAWTDPEVLRRWWAAGPDWDTPTAEVDLRPGGSYRLSMRNPETGDVHTVAGEYREVRRPDRLEYTWAWQDMDGDDGRESLVAVDFHAEGDRTSVVLTHSGLADEGSKQRHAHGWNGCLDNLAGRVLNS